MLTVRYGQLTGEGLSPSKMRRLAGCSPNAGHQARLKAVARDERRLEAVACMPMLGPYAAAQPYNGKELLSVSGLLLIPSWEQSLGRRGALPQGLDWSSPGYANPCPPATLPQPRDTC